MGELNLFLLIKNNIVVGKSSDFEIVKEGNSYIFVTKGCGHGVGLSQYGAQGMAKEGYNYQAILKHYYQGVEISKNKE